MKIIILLGKFDYFTFHRFLAVIFILILPVNGIHSKVVAKGAVENHGSENSCISSDEEFEAVYKRLNSSRSQNVDIRNWDWRENVSLSSSLSSSMQINCANGHDNVLKIRDSDINFTPDGFLAFANTYYPPNQYCHDSVTGVTRLCDHDHFVVVKCCGVDEIWDMSRQHCVPSNLLFRPKMSTENLTQLPFQLLSHHKNSSGDDKKVVWPTATSFSCPEGFEMRTLIEDNDTCSSMSWPVLRNLYLQFTNSEVGNSSLKSNSECLHEAYKPKCRFKVTPTGIRYETSGGLFHKKSRWKDLEENLSYCIDGYFTNPLCQLVNPSTDNPIILEKCRSSLKGVLVLCEPAGFLESEGETEHSKSVAYTLVVIWLSTCPLLLSAAMANLLIIQKNVHGWTLSCYLLSMCLVNINSAVLGLDAIENKAVGCRVIDFSMKFLYFSTLCWMTSINFGLWRTFRSKLPSSNKSPLRFLCNLLFSLCTPIVTVTVSYYAAQEDDICTDSYCALYSHSTLPFYTGPIVFLVLMNLALFIRTSIIIARSKRETNSVLQNEGSKSIMSNSFIKTNLDSFRLFAKLFLMTGSIWVVRIVLVFFQLKRLYITWYGVLLEAIFSFPEAASSIVVLMHPEFRKWIWRKYPALSRKLSGIACCVGHPEDASVNLELGIRQSNQTTLQVGVNSVTRSPTTTTTSR